MIKPNAAIIRELKAYDSNLSLEWNNKEKCFEVYYLRPTGKKLITPIVESIYIDGGDTKKFVPVDSRILDWLYSADTKRTNKNWKWIGRKRYDNRISNQNRKTREKFINIAKDNYNLVNNEMINPLIDESNWVAPDITSGSRKRVMYRSGDNAKKSRGE